MCRLVTSSPSQSLHRGGAEDAESYGFCSARSAASAVRSSWTGSYRLASRWACSVNRLVIRAPNWLGRRGDGAAGDGRGARGVSAARTSRWRRSRRSRRSSRRRRARGQDSVIALAESGRRESRRSRPAEFDAIVLLPNSFRSAWSARGGRRFRAMGLRGRLSAVAPDARRSRRPRGRRASVRRTTSIWSRASRTGVPTADHAAAHRRSRRRRCARGGRVAGRARHRCRRRRLHRLRAGRRLRSREALAAAHGRRDHRPALARVWRVGACWSAPPATAIPAVR